MSAKKKDEIFYMTPLRILRMKNRIPLGELADAANMSTSYLCRLERGQMQVGQKSIEKILRGYKKLKIKVDVDHAIRKTRSDFKARNPE